MAWYKCSSCGHTFNSGFFKNYSCTKCYGFALGLGGLIKKVIITAAIIAGVMFILNKAIPSIGEKATTTTLAALDTTMLFSYSKDAYLESLIRGRLDNKFYTIYRTERPYYSAILAHSRVETAEPVGVLPAGAVVELRSAVRRGEHVWIPASFYVGEKLKHAFVLFPREWEEAVRVFEWDPAVLKIKAEYEKVIRANFKLMEVKASEEKEYQEKYNDYFKVREIVREVKDEKIYFYAPKTDKAKIDKVYAYYLNPNNISMVIMQTDKEWQRPALVIHEPEEEK